MKFKIGDKVCAVDRGKFFENIEKGNFVICEVYEIIPYDKEKDFLYRAKDDAGNIFCGFENKVSNSPTELISINYLIQTLKVKSNEYIGKAYNLREMINEVNKSLEN